MGLCVLSAVQGAAASGSGGTGGKNESLEREAQDAKTVVVLSFTFIMLDIWKQVFSYAMKYFNNNT